MCIVIMLSFKDFFPNIQNYCSKYKAENNSLLIENVYIVLLHKSKTMSLQLLALVYYLTMPLIENREKCKTIHRLQKSVQK